MTQIFFGNSLGLFTEKELYIYIYDPAYEIDICLVTVTFYVFSSCKCLTYKKKELLCSKNFHIMKIILLVCYYQRCII